jgi:succinate dehydrogenase / fumarate reductase cytochrome b subunit
VSINNKISVDKSIDRPVFLDLFLIRLPIGGIVSIVHRVTGILLVLLTPFAIYLLDRSLSSPEFFNHIKTLLAHWWVRLLVLTVLAVFIQHLFSGLRHLALDIDWGIEKQQARITSWLTFVSTVLVLVTAGYLMQ